MTVEMEIRKNRGNHITDWKAKCLQIILSYFLSTKGDSLGRNGWHLDVDYG